MFVVGNLLSAVADLLNGLFTIYGWAILIRVLLTWVSPDPFNPVVQFLNQVTDPYLNIFRRVIPPIGPIDISPIIAMMVLHYLLQPFLVRTLLDLSLRLR